MEPWSIIIIRCLILPYVYIYILICIYIYRCICMQTHIYIYIIYIQLYVYILYRGWPQSMNWTIQSSNRYKGTTEGSENVRFFWWYFGEVIGWRENLQESLVFVSTVKRTRQFHVKFPLNPSNKIPKIHSSSDDISININECDKPNNRATVLEGLYTMFLWIWGRFPPGYCWESYGQPPDSV